MIACWMPCASFSEPQAVFLRLKGIGIGSQITGSASGLCVAGDFAYVSHSGGFEIFCVKNPAEPVRVGGYETQSPANAIQMTGHYICLALGTTITNTPGAFEIINVRDSSKPMRVAHMSTLARANDIRVSGNYAYLAESARWTGSNSLGALEILDISAPANPVPLGIFDTLGSATSVAVSGNNAYLVDDVAELQVINVSDPHHPRRAGMYQPDLSSCSFEPLGPANHVQVVGDLAYLAGDDGLNVLDISDPSQPVGVFNNGCIPVYSLLVRSPYVYIAIYHSFLNTFFLHIAETTNPINWPEVGVKEDWRPARMEVAGNFLYLATNPLCIYEFSNRPVIQSIAIKEGDLTLAWDYAPGFVIQRSVSLTEPVWITVPGSEGQNRLKLPATGQNGFFRLASP